MKLTRQTLAALRRLGADLQQFEAKERRLLKVGLTGEEWSRLRAVERRLCRETSSDDVQVAVKRAAKVLARPELFNVYQEQWRERRREQQIRERARSASVPAKARNGLVSPRAFTAARVTRVVPAAIETDRKKH